MHAIPSLTRTLAQLAPVIFLCPILIAQTQQPVDSTVKLEVPFVGCASDGQVGPLDVPEGKAKAVAISEDVAQHLAYYKASEGPGVLAPRGWHCFATYGSDGSALYVSPQPITGTQLLSSTWKGFSGPAIELVLDEGGTYGRFAVARMVARIFPAHKKFLEDVIAENVEPPSAFLHGPYPADQITYRGKDIVEYRTPADTVGLGTEHSWLQKSSRPISGVAIFVPGDPVVLFLATRLPEDQHALAAAIMHQVERDAAAIK